MTCISFSSTPALAACLQKFQTSGNQTPALELIRAALDGEAQKFTRLCQHLDHNLSVLHASLEHITTVIDTLEELGGLTVQARNCLADPLAQGLALPDDSTSHPSTKEYEARFRRTLIKLDSFVNGLTLVPNLLLGQALATSFAADDRLPLVTQGALMTAESLGFRKPDFTTGFTVQNARIDVMNAMDMAVTVRNIIVSDIALISSRRAFAAQSIDSSFQDITFAPDQFTLDPVLYRNLFSIPLFVDDEEAAACAPETSIIAQFTHSYAAGE